MGTVFQGRYKSILVDEDSYALVLSAYIHLNPLRAGVVKHLEEYQWSSFLDYIGTREAVIERLDVSFILNQFGNNLAQAQERVLFSHRILRWLTGFFMGILFILNSIILISGELLYWGFFLTQIIFYSFAIAGKYQKLKIGRIFYSFLSANLASSIAIINLLTGKRISAWKN